MLADGYIFGIVVLGILIIVCLAVIIYNIVQVKLDNYDTGDNITGIIIAIACFLSIAACAVFTPLGFYPYDMQYHSYSERSGVVTTISDRLIGSGDGIEQKFVVVFEGDDQAYGCKDTRCALLEEGDFLELSCIRVWQYVGSHGYDCAFVDLKKAS